ncbi:hypothetical protein C5167_050306 [Papaver somniferum]|uniref:F-box domain-containing protein n=1 Tax=Papaver somniferum TaxID=3469 RepID=A0A4Y7KRQ3_PAPSO|nr:hypothetical protein C5167_050306 [Papaver somniferum]
MSQIPEDIIINILSRLPIDSIARFRCVSKSWSDLFSNPYLFKLHRSMFLGIIEDSQNPSFRTGKSFDIETVDVRYGFSYDPKNEDHRVGTLVITSFRSADLNVYSLKADIWKTSSIQFVHAPKGELQFCNGKLHWLETN